MHKYPDLPPILKKLRSGKPLKGIMGEIRSIPEMFNKSVILGLSQGQDPGLTGAEFMDSYFCTKGNYQNYFISDESVCDFLSNNEIKEKDFFKATSLIEDNLEYSPMPDEVKSGEDDKYIYFAIHMVDRKHSISGCFVDAQMYDAKKRKLMKHKMLYSLCGDTQIYNGADVSYVPMDDEKTFKRNAKVIKDAEHVRVLLNLFMYMDAFPESVIDGPPPVSMQSGYRSKGNYIIGASKEIKDIYSYGMSPHLRRGHFRFLKSEVFKKKRYQTVYVKPTMVKGHASHVVECEAV